MKKTILYIIDSLERGGAEVLLVSSLKEIHQRFNIIIVTLRPQISFSDNELFYDKIFCLDMRKKIDIFQGASKLRKIISENQVDLIHSTLFWSVITARLAVTKKIKHIFSLATIMSSGLYTTKWYSSYTRWLDRLTYSKNQALISPTKEVLTDFDNSIGIKGEKKVIYNFVKDDFFENEIEYRPTPGRLKLVAVGNLKSVKNYQLIIDAFKLMQGRPISIDIYGEGPDKEILQKQISQYDLPIRLMGAEEKIYEILPYYDAFVMCSILEGFGIAAAEAMAMGLPLLLSDIKPLREISHNNAIFFNPYDPHTFFDAVLSLEDKAKDLKEISERGKKIAKENYTKEKYLNQLLNYYDEILNPNEKLN